jgi:hypothetical protein
MKLKLFLAVLIVLCAGQGWGATIYVIPDPETATAVCYLSGGFPVVAAGACTSGTKGSQLEAANAAVGAGGGTMILAAGTYTGAMLGTTSGRFRTQRANQLIRPASAADSAVGGYLPAYAGTVILDGAGAAASTLVSGYAGTEVRDITFKAPGNANASVSVTASGLTLTRPKSLLGTGHVGSIFLDSNCGAACTSTTNNLLHTSGNKLLGASINANHTPTINYSRIHSPATQTWHSPAVFNDCIFTGTTAAWLTTSGNSGLAATWNNSIFYGNSLTTGNTHILSVSHDQTWTLNNCIAIGNPWDNDSYNFNGVTINDSIRNADPLFVSPRYPGIFVLAVDDRGTEGDGSGIEYFEDIAPKIEGYGWKGTLALNYTNGLTAGQWTKVNTFYVSGHEISNHGRNGAQVSNNTTTPPVFSVAKAGQTIEITATHLTISGQTPILLAGHTMKNLQDHITADAGGTVSAANATFDYTPATLLAAVAAGTSINAALALSVDRTAFFAEEIATAKTDIETNVSGYTVTSFVPYGNYSDATLQTYLSTRYTGARGPTVTSTLTSLNAYDINVKSLSTSIGDTNTCEAIPISRDECVRRNTAALISQANEQGRIWVLLAHTTAEFALVDWDSMLAVIKASNIQVMTLTEATNFAKTYNPSSDLATADNITYTRTLVDGSNYKLKAGSPARNAGTDVSLTSDYAGNTIWAQPDIGAYEKSQGADITLGTGVGTSVITSGSGGSMTMTYDYD